VANYNTDSTPSNHLTSIN